MTASAPATTQASRKSHLGLGRGYDQKNGFSIIPPVGWTNTGEAGAHFMSYLGPVDDGFAASFNVVGMQDDGTLTAIEEIARSLKRPISPGHKLAGDGYATIDGKKSYWYCDKFTKDSMNLQGIQYIIPGGNGNLYMVTFATLESNFDKYRPIFESAAMTVVTD
jgi:hypothetical protein